MPGRAPKTIPVWTGDKLDDILAGADPDGLRSFDQKGLSATSYAALDGNRAIHRVESRLEELEKPSAPEESQLDLLIQLVETLTSEVQALRAEVRANTIALGRTPNADGRAGSSKRG